MTQDKELCFLWDNTIHGAIPAFEKFEAAFAFEKVFEHPYCPEEVDLRKRIGESVIPPRCPENTATM